MNTSTIFATILGLSISTFGCMVGDHASDNSDEDILGGTDDAGDPSVVQLRAIQRTATGTSIGGCTATVIAPTVLLTAAHCIPAGAARFQYNPAATASTFDLNGAGWINAVAGIPHPAYTGDATAGHDVAVVILASDVGLAASPLGAAPANGSTVRAVGYGRNEAKGGPGVYGSGTKRSVDIVVSAVTDREFVAGVDLQGTCHGDSGGPIFQNGVVVGTTSYGSTGDCRGGSHLMRVDDNRGFLDTYTGGGGGGGGGGSSTSQCEVAVDNQAVSCTSTNGGAASCQCKVDGQVVSTCTAADPTNACSVPGNCCGF